MRVHKPHKNFDQWVSESDRLLNVTCNGISVIYVTAHICAGRLKRRWDIRSGSNRQRHVVVFFNTVIQRNRPIWIAFYDTHWDTENLLSSYIPGSPRRNCKQRVKEKLSKDYLPRYWIWFCDVLGVPFALFCVLALAMNISQTQVSKKTDPPLHVIQNILYQIYILMFLESKIAFAIL